MAKLEDEIKQYKFKNVHQKMYLNILVTANILSAESNRLLKPFGLSNQQYNILRILRGQYPGPATVNLLIERMMDKMSNASRLVEKLRKKGWVERRICENDRRAVDVIITPAGLDLLAKIDEQAEVMEKQLRHLSREEAETISNLLDKLRG